MHLLHLASREIIRARARKTARAARLTQDQQVRG